MRPVPPDVPGADNDLKDKLEDAVVKALREEGSVIYAFGEKWGPETNKKDQYFHFKPGNGIHDIHMNQGNDDQWKRDNGTYQDGAIYVEYPEDKWSVFYLAFQSQSFDTDDDGNRISPTGGSTTTKKRQPGRRQSAKKPAKKSASAKPAKLPKKRRKK